MRLRPFWSYYGAKYNLATLYPAPTSEIVIEPFAGSAQYSLLYHNKDVRLYDLDENICMVWDYLIHAKESQIKKLTLDFEHLDDLKGYTQEEKILMGFWCGKSIAYPQKKPTEFALSKNTADYIQRAVKQVQYIRHWKIYQCSYEKIPNQNATWFIDPPYKKGGHKYRCSSKDIDYEHLAQWCTSRRGSIIVCEMNNATWLPFVRLSLARSCYRKSHDNIEVVYTNVESPQVSLGLI